MALNGFKSRQLSAWALAGITTYHRGPNQLHRSTETCTVIAEHQQQHPQSWQVALMGVIVSV
jgi:hypothetical protein